MEGGTVLRLERGIVRVGELERRDPVEHRPQGPVHGTVHDPAFDRVMVDQDAGVHGRVLLDKEGDLFPRGQGIDRSGKVDRHGHTELAGHRGKVTGGAAHLGDQSADSAHDLGVARCRGPGHHHRMVGHRGQGGAFIDRVYPAGGHPL